MDFLTGAGLGLGIIGGIGKMIGRGAQNRQLRRLMKNDPQYQINPLAEQRLGLARTLLNARMPGAIQAERNIFRSGANATASAQRAATDASQLLATAGDIQGRQSEAFTNLGMNEAQDYQRRYGNLVGAQEGMINEGDKVFQDKIRRFQNQLQSQGLQSANKQATWGDISNLGFGLADFGMQGGFNGMFGGGQPKKLSTRMNYIGSPVMDRMGG